MFPKQGRIDEIGIGLSDEMIFWEDVQGVEVDKNFLIISLMPYSVLGKIETKYIIPEHQCIVISVGGEDIFLLKSSIDRRMSLRQAKERLSGMSEDQIAKYFRYINCPHCNALIDLTDYPVTFYVFCPYCHTICDKHATPLTGYKNYRICPECNMFGKVSYYIDYQYFYKPHQRIFYKKRYYCCDACAGTMFKKHILKNLPLVIGAVLSFQQWIKTRKDREDSFEDLHKANHYALMGAVNEAKNIYHSILLRLPHHPGIHYNIGYMYFRIGNREKASYYFQKALQQCGNYLPLIFFLKKYESVTIAEDTTTTS
ncbi:MAG: tetratricopeptide repeat protein, partial [Flammeovirgaceae bacterium]|nr:tetratricopeptide repeat protein [Flammeovirgaceae bacterium]MDW8286558.1 tetratricopeptide repeat protein [Flammeovirgaceae bacterium]